MNANGTQLDTKKASKLGVGAAVLLGTVGLAVVGWVAPAIAFAGPLQSGAGLVQPLAHQAQPVAQHGDYMAVVWAIFGGGIILGIALGVYVRSKRSPAGKQVATHRLWFTLAVIALAVVIVDVNTGRSFTYDLIFAVVTASLGVLSLIFSRRQNRGA